MTSTTVTLTNQHTYMVSCATAYTSGSAGIQSVALSGTTLTVVHYGPFDCIDMGAGTGNDGPKVIISTPDGVYGVDNYDPSGGGGDYVEPVGIYWIMIKDEAEHLDLMEIRGYNTGTTITDLIQVYNSTNKHIYVKKSPVDNNGGIDIELIGSGIDAYATSFVPSYATGNQPYVITINADGTLTNPYGPY